jgi:CBS domain-containing protein
MPMRGVTVQRLHLRTRAGGDAIMLYAFLSLAARDAMTRSVVTVPPDQSLAELERIFERHTFNSCPVVENEQLIGIVSKLDFLKAFLFDNRSVAPLYENVIQQTVRDAMTATVITVREDQSLLNVLQMMVDLRTKSFPVVNQDGAVVGIIAREDIARSVLKSTGA